MNRNRFYPFTRPSRSGHSGYPAPPSWPRRRNPEDDEGVPEDFWGDEASGIMYTTGARVLLTLRSEEVLEPFTWGVPGGAIESGEDAYPSALREVREELGRNLPKGEVIDRYVFQTPSKSFRYTTFIVAVPESAVELKFRLNWENDDWGWFTQRELASIDVHFGAKIVFKHKSDVIFFAK